MRSFRTHLLTLLAALLVLLSGGASARTQDFCHVMGRVMPSCCCETDEHVSDSGSEVQIRSEGCCELISSPGHAAMPSTRNEAAKLSAAPFLAIVTESAPVTPDVPPSECETRSPQTRAPPGIGPPLFLAHCAFLI